MTLRAAPKVTLERARAMLHYAIDQREQHGALFVSVMTSELEALAHEVINWRTNHELVEGLERAAQVHCTCGVNDEASAPDARLAWRHSHGCPHAVSKSSIKNEHADAAKNDAAPGASRK